MDAIKFLKESGRLCHSLVNSGCKECPMYEFYRYGCILYSEVKPERMDDLKRAISILEQWAKEHPEKTRLEDFREKFPDAEIDCDGTPKKIRPIQLGYCKGTTCDQCGKYVFSNRKCWEQSLEEE